MALKSDPGLLSNLRDQLLATEGKEGSDLEKGTVVGEDYVVGERVNEGGSAVIYKCHRRSEPNKVFALKVTYPKSTNAARRFQAEVNASYQVRHPNVLRSIDCLFHGSALAYIMEYAPGGDLRDILDRQQEIPLSTFFILARQLASGLNAIHRQGIVHRDIKPENILFTTDGQIKIADFGISFSSEESRITTNGSLVGTINYMAPEYVRRGIFDPRSDIFSLGVMLYELLTGKHPYGYSKSLEELLERMSKRVLTVSEVRADCPYQLSNVISRLLALDPSERHQNAEELEIELTLIEQQYLLNSGEGSVFSELHAALAEKRPFRKSRLYILMKFLIFMVGTIVITGVIFYYLHANGLI